MGFKHLKAVAFATVGVASGEAAVAAGDVWGYTRFDCGDEIAYEYDSVDEACRDPVIKSFVDRSTGYPACTVCDDDDGGDGGGGGGGIVIPIPDGLHCHGIDCHDDHVCGDDEIGGGDEDCEACPDGDVPNEDGTACVTCEHGEHAMKPGTCACDQKSVDDLAISQLKNVPKNPWGHFEKYYCAGGLSPSVGSRTYSTNGQTDVCSLEGTSEVMSWILSSIAVGHSHPYFDPGRDYSGDNAVQCGSTIINSAQKAGIFNHVIGRQFSDADMQWSKPTYLVVPLRDEVKVYRPDTNSEESIWTQ